MIEETYTFEDKGEKYKWVIVHNLEDFGLDLLGFHALFHKHFPDRFTNLVEFCMFVMVNAKQEHPSAQCFPKYLIDKAMGELN